MKLLDQANSSTFGYETYQTFSIRLCKKDLARNLSEVIAYFTKMLSFFNKRWLAWVFLSENKSCCVLSEYVL